MTDVYQTLFTGLKTLTHCICVPEVERLQKPVTTILN